GRLDDILGDGFWLLTKEAAHAPPPNVKQVVLNRDITDETGRLDKWLEDAGATATLIRPDRHVFGTGSVRDLVNAYAAQLLSK
ncbi:MAG: monooxygenase, partial [Alphaproteobacteria bacterium]|nr:monooxygenase [Alphaproteobacteria bacterium]